MRQTLERLAAAGFRLIPVEDLRGHFLFERGGYLALVDDAGEGFGGVGNPGILTERGFAVLVRTENSYLFAAKGLKVPASDEQVLEARRFANDLRTAIAAPSA